MEYYAFLDALSGLNIPWTNQMHAYTRLGKSEKQPEQYVRNILPKPKALHRRQKFPPWSILCCFSRARGRFGKD